MADKRIILKVDVSEESHRKFKQKCGNRYMKDRIRKLIVADAEGRIAFIESKKYG